MKAHPLTALVASLTAIASSQAAAQRDETVAPPPPAEYNAQLLLTNGISAVDGASGGGIANWATIAGRQSDRVRGAGASGCFYEQGP